MQMYRDLSHPSSQAGITRVEAHQEEVATTEMTATTAEEMTTLETTIDVDEPQAENKTGSRD